MPFVSIADESNVNIFHLEEWIKSNKFEQFGNRCRLVYIFVKMNWRLKSERKECSSC